MSKKKFEELVRQRLMPKTCIRVKRILIIYRIYV